VPRRKKETFKKPISLGMICVAVLTLLQLSLLLLFFFYYESLDQCAAIHMVTSHTFSLLIRPNGFSCITADLIGRALTHATMIVFMTASSVTK
jgi:hypothetical protein